MNINNLTDIEKLARDEFAHAEQQPPAEVWEHLSQRMIAEGLTATHSDAGNASRPFLRTPAGRTLMGSLVVAAVGATLFFFLHSSPATVRVEKAASQLTTAPFSLTTPTDKDISTTDILETPTEVTDSFQHSQSAQPVQASEPVQQPQPAPSTQPTPTPTPTPSVQQTQPLQPTPRIQQSQSSRPSLPVGDDVLPDDTPSSLDAAVTTPSTTPALDTVTPREAILTRIPNVITPNADGINDCWVLANIEEYGPLQLQIFNAQSQRVYQSSDYRNDFCGNDLPDGNYFYVLVVKSRNIVRRGVLVIRR